MKVSEQWLREWVDPPLTARALAEQLTMAGLEVDAIHPAAGDFSGVVVGEVLEVAAHPDADKLRVCRVAVGSGDALQIVCGASNVAPAMKVPTALISAQLPGGLKIKKTKLRGVESSGMLCSARELGLAEDSQGLLALASDAPVGQDLREYLRLDDHIIEIDLTPNRGDCLSLAGIAREVGVLNRCAVKRPSIAAVSPACDDRFTLRIDAPDACPRYLGRIIRGINPQAETPLWMQERLRRGGLRSLGPLVDVTNYILLELGQPMHAFDLARLTGHIEVRWARAGEVLRLLDERKVELDSETLVIADAQQVLAMAGIMGGAASGVGDSTQDLFLECAFFTPELIAGRARRYGLQTDSAHRFERGVDYELQQQALERATQLLLEIAGGQAGPILEARDEQALPNPQPIQLRRERIQRVLGLELSDNEIEDILQRLGTRLTAHDQGWEVLPPSFRFDLRLEVDLIEELGRVHGYDRVPSTRPVTALQGRPEPEAQVGIAQWRNILTQRGYYEAITYSFVDPKLQALLDTQSTAIALANPLSSELSVMRTSLWPGLIKAVQYNLNRQQSRVRFFEYGLNYRMQDSDINQKPYIAGIACGNRYPEQWGLQPDALEYYDVKGDVLALLGAAGCENDYRFVADSTHSSLHPGRAARIERNETPVGWLGNLHPELIKTLELPENTIVFELDAALIESGQQARFTPISRYPAIRRDLAFVVPEQVTATALCAAAQAAAGPLLVDLILFDLYQGKGIESGRKSIALGLILQDSSRTLAEQDVEAVLTQVQSALSDQFGANLRE